MSLESKNLLNKLTLIVPTYERQNYAIRNMLYWSGSEITVHILDGSVNPIQNQIIDGMDDNIQYHHFKIPLRDRLNIAFDLINTEYVALLGDDEFFLYSGLHTCINELECDKELVSCMGRTVGFEQSENEILGYPGYINQKDHDISHDNPITRMIMHFCEYSPSTIYSVVRSHVWKNSMLAFTTKKEFNVFAMGEIQFELSTVFQGKSKVISELLLLRSRENEGIRNTKEDKSLDTENRFKDWWRNPAKQEEKKEFINIMASILADLNIIRNNNIANGILEALNGYYESLEKKSPKKYIKLIKKIIPSTTIKFIKFFFNKKTNKTQVMTLTETIIWLEKNDNVSFDPLEIDSLYRIIASFHHINKI